MTRTPDGVAAYRDRFNARVRRSARIRRVAEYAVCAGAGAALATTWYLCMLLGGAR